MSKLATGHCNREWADAADMNQTRIGSLIEALVHTAIGFLTSYVGGLVIYPMFGFRPTLAQNLAIVVAFTVISVVRGYIVRRWFNARLQRAARRLAQGIRGVDE